MRSSLALLTIVLCAAAVAAPVLAQTVVSTTMAENADGAHETSLQGASTPSGTCEPPFTTFGGSFQAFVGSDTAVDGLDFGLLSFSGTWTSGNRFVLFLSELTREGSPFLFLGDMIVEWKDSSEFPDRFSNAAELESADYTEVGRYKANAFYSPDGIDISSAVEAYLQKAGHGSHFYLRFRFEDCGLGSTSDAYTVFSLAPSRAPRIVELNDFEMLLNNDRFRVTTTFRTPSDESGTGKAVKLTSDTGYFTFFNAANVEMVVKVLNGCPFTGHYWVFAGGLTNVEVELTVVDTQNPTEMANYNNPLGTAFKPIQDTRAFATCP